jgi:hypothetical protein
MGEFDGMFGDKRRAAGLARLQEAMVAQSTVVVRRLGEDRAGEMSIHGVLQAPQVKAAKIVECLARRTAVAATGRRVVVAQDTTEVNYPGHRRKRLGPAGRRGQTPGFFLHAAVAIDAGDEAVLGVVAARLWTRDDAPVADRRKRGLAEKHSHRWLEMAQRASERLAGATERIVVGDRESDFYQLFARRPADTHLIVRACQDRALSEGGLLFAAAQAWPVLGGQRVKVASRGPGDAGRIAKLVLRAGVVELRHPRNGQREGDPASLTVTLVEAQEVDAPAGVEPLHWRLLTTLPADDLAEAMEVVRLYRLRWRIEQCFRTLKKDGLDIEASQITREHPLLNLVAVALGAAVRILQLVDARHGSHRPASDVASAAEIEAALELGPTLERNSERQRNPYPPRSLAWLAWIIARLGGWNCYYKPPGPKTMRQGWDRFAAIAEGFTLARATAPNS